MEKVSKEEALLIRKFLNEYQSNIRKKTVDSVAWLLK